MLLIKALYNIPFATSFIFPTFFYKDEQYFLNLQTFFSINTKFSGIFQLYFSFCKIISVTNFRLQNL
jgi:hypothetical protein